MLTPSLVKPEQVGDPESPDLFLETNDFFGPKRFTWRGGWTITAAIQCPMTNSDQPHSSSHGELQPNREDCSEKKQRCRK